MSINLSGQVNTTMTQTTQPQTIAHESATKEEKYLEYILTHAERNNPDSIIEETHNFAIKRHWLMNIGPEKSPIVEEVLQEKRPKARHLPISSKIIMEIGCYLGYSAIRFASYVKNTLGIQDVKYYSLEISETHANIAAQIIKGSSDESIKEFPSTFNLFGKLDFVVIDHSKTVYKRDLQLLEKSGAFHTVSRLENFYQPFEKWTLTDLRPHGKKKNSQGTTIIADNVILPGAPDYLEYVRSEPTKYQTRFVESWLEYYEGVERDGMEISVWLK
ncbi:hypothetical protein BC937DRAFT_88839 [Endogone sp. FLAS-F59071]|nr:hypothetical protein BC937DRAFT_88839 [Endogone sp. FLAS-F59071]|eukprot:RUS18367.1 hypothetical protein BC937DRAFT_88839 [Endogone sp. FLAS-F59071]